MSVEWPLIYTELQAKPLLSSAACESKVWRLSNFDEFLIPVPVLLIRALSRDRYYLPYRTCSCIVALPSMILIRSFIKPVNIKYKWGINEFSDNCGVDFTYSFIYVGLWERFYFYSKNATFIWKYTQWNISVLIIFCYFFLYTIRVIRVRVKYF